MVQGALSLSNNDDRVMTVLSNENPPAGLIRCISTAAQAEKELDRIATRTTGAAQREAEQRVQEILEQVRGEGDQALISLTEQFDGFRPEPLRIDPGLLEPVSYTHLRAHET